MRKPYILITIIVLGSCGHSRSSLVDRQRTIKDSLEIVGKRIVIRKMNVYSNILDSMHRNSSYDDVIFGADTLIASMELRRIDSGGYYASWRRLEKEYDSLEFELKK